MLAFLISIFWPSHNLPYNCFIFFLSLIFSKKIFIVSLTTQFKPKPPQAPCPPTYWVISIRIALVDLKSDFMQAFCALGLQFQLFFRIKIKGKMTKCNPTRLIKCTSLIWACFLIYKRSWYTCISCQTLSWGTKNLHILAWTSKRVLKAQKYYRLTHAASVKFRFSSSLQCKVKFQFLCN